MILGAGFSTIFQYEFDKMDLLIECKTGFYEHFTLDAAVNVRLNALIRHGKALSPGSVF